MQVLETVDNLLATMLIFLGKKQIVGNILVGVKFAKNAKTNSC